MMYDSLLSRSFSKHEKKKLGYGGLIVCLLIALSFSTVFKPYLGPLPVLNLRLSIGEVQKLKILNETSSSLLISNDAEIARKNDESINNASCSQQVVKDILVNDSAVKLNNGNGSNQIVIEVETKTKNDKTPAIFTNSSNSQQMILLKDVECRKLERSDFCKIKGDIRIDPNSSTVYIISSEETSQNTSIFTIRPYARKGDPTAMNNVRQWSLKQLHHHHRIPQCSQFHHLPAILFSLGGYSGNHFHAFTDIIIPLYSTARPYNRSVQFLTTDYRSWLVSKFKMLLKGLSEYEIIDIDKKDDNIHCFTDLTLGLKRYSTKELSIDPSKADESSSMKDFRQLLRSSYSLRKTTALKIKNKNNIGIKKRPKLVIISRKRSRAFSNVDEIAKLAKGLGFKAVVYEPDADLSRAAQVLNSCDIVLGVHGAGLTNMVFLPENAILIQVIPFGGAEWVSKNYFEEPSKDMNIRYLEYKIRLEESSLIQQYPSDHLVLRNPYVIQKQGWMAFKSIYFDKQNVNLDLNRFRPTLLKALELLHQ